MMKGKIKIYLCDLANDFNGIDNKSIPLGIGYIGAYCQKIHKDFVELKLFRTYKDFWDEVERGAPDIVGFGSYDWNFNLTLNTIKKLKNLKQDVLVVVGGANVGPATEENFEFLQEYPFIDFLVYGDGEKPFSNIVSLYLENRGKENFIKQLRNNKINGVRSIYEGNKIIGEYQDAVMELDEIPSPWLNGLFDHLLVNPSLMPIIQNVRGCPYLCRYCVSGSQFGKIRNFSYDRVISEIQYLEKKAANRFIRFSDDNFGIIKHDQEVATYIRNSFETRNYPVGLKAYSAKRQNSRLREVAIILKPLMTYCISFQTTTKDVLKESKRTSATMSEATESIEFARQHGLSTATELIFGLPGETIESWKEVINTTLSLGFDSISMNPLWLLKGSDLSTKKSRNHYQYIGKFLLAENAVTNYDDFLSIERDEIAISSVHFSFEEWKMFLKLQIKILMLSYYGYGKELLYYALAIGVKPTELFEYLYSNPEKFPVANQIADEYVQLYTQYMFDTEQELYEYVKKNLEIYKKDKESLLKLNKGRSLYGYLVKYMLRDPEKRYLHEIKNALVELRPTREVQQAATFLLDLSLKMMIDPFQDYIPDLEVIGNYDIQSWIADGYKKDLHEYLTCKPNLIKLKSRNQFTVAETIRKDREANRTDCFHFFRYMNSGLMRRYIVNKQEQKENNIPFEPFLREHRTSSLGG